MEMIIQEFEYYQVNRYIKAVILYLFDPILFLEFVLMHEMMKCQQGNENEENGDEGT
jgi:hypothetical protein